MIKKRTFAVVAIIAAVLLLASAFVVYSYYTPNISIAISKPAEENADRYFEFPIVSVSEKMGLPLPESVKKNLRTWNEETSKAMQEISAMSEPYNIKTEVRVTDKKTTVIFDGEKRENGESKEYYKELNFDFVLTEDILS